MGDLTEATHHLPGDSSGRLPCLVELKQVTALDQVWATDITYIPLRKGLLCLVAIMDSNPDMHSAEGSSTALIHKTAIFHSVQVCQFAFGDVVAWLQEDAIEISWSGRKCCCDNVLMQQLWRIFKGKNVYLRACNGWVAEISLARFLPPRVGAFRGRDLINTGLHLSGGGAAGAG